jgi:hypothetical protein
MRITRILLFLSVLVLTAVTGCFVDDTVDATAKKTVTTNGSGIAEEVPLPMKDGYYVFGGDILLSPDDENHKKLIQMIIDQKKSTAASTSSSSSIISGINKAVYINEWYIDPWPNGVIEYYYDKNENIPQIIKDRIVKATHEIENKCNGIRFKEKSQTWDYETGLKVKIETDEKAGGSCTYGYALNKDGHLGGSIYLKENTGFTTEEENVGVIIHELCHGLGLMHEHQRSDRDSYIILHPENVLDSYFDTNFALNPNSKTYGSYSYDSIMHYGGTAFTKNDKITIETRDPSKQDIIGQRKKMSSSDVDTLNYLYRGNAGDFGYWEDDWHFCSRWENKNHPWQHWIWEDKTHTCWFQGSWQWVVLWQYDVWDWSSWSWKKENWWGWKWVEKENVIHCGYYFEPHQQWTYKWEDNWYNELVIEWKIHCGSGGWPHQIWKWKNNLSFE